MARIVEAYVADISVAQDALPNALETAGVHRLTDLVGEDCGIVLTVSRTWAELETLFLLGLALSMKAGDGGLAQVGDAGLATVFVPLTIKRCSGYCGVFTVAVGWRLPLISTAKAMYTRATPSLAASGPGLS